MDSKLWILLNPVTHLVQKHSETALDTLKKEGTESSFPEKMHLIVQHKAWPSVKSHGFTDEAVKMAVPSVKWQVFTDDLKKLVLIAPIPWCKNQKKNRKPLKTKDLRFIMYPEDYLFSNQFMEDLGRIYQLRKYFPSFEDA